MTAATFDPGTWTGEAVVLPDGTLAFIIDAYDDGDVLVALPSREAEPPCGATLTDTLALRWAIVALADCTNPTTDEVESCHRCDDAFDGANEGRFCDVHGWLCGPCDDAADHGRGCFVD